MGIKGFFTYMKGNHCDCMESFDLHSSKLVIDGNMLLRKIYISATCNDCFGGDYDIYSRKIREFFQMLKKCDIESFVLMDGIGGSNKWLTLKQRTDGKLQTALGWTPKKEESTKNNRNANKAFPLMIQNVFKNVLEAENIKFVQCISEADDVIVSLANKLNCPLLSDDSDFYIFDVKIIQINLLQLELRDLGNGKFSLPCKKFNRERFLRKFPGLTLQHLHLGAVILGNDYVNPSTFADFRNKYFKNNNYINECLQWLGNTGSVEKAKEILPKMTMTIDENMRRYEIQPADRFPECDVLLDPVKPRNKPDSSNESYPNVEKEILETVKSLPRWFNSNYLRGKYSAYFLDLLVNQKNLCPTQIEDRKLPSGFDSALDILKVIYGILSSAIKKERKTSVTYTARQGSWLIDKELDCSAIIESPWLPTLKKIEILPHEERKGVIKSCLSISDTLENGVPEEWTLYIFAIQYWFQKSSSNVSKETYRYTLLLLLFSNIIIKKIGYYRTMKDLEDLGYGQDFDVAKQEEPGESSNNDIRELCKSVTKGDCWNVAKILIPSYQMDNSDPFIVQIVHYFNEFQVCFCHILQLNALLDFPYANPKVSELLNGTLFYNLSKKVQIFVKQELQGSPKFVQLLECLKSKLGITASIDEIKNDWNSQVPRAISNNYLGHPTTSLKRPGNDDPNRFGQSSKRGRNYHGNSQNNVQFRPPKRKGNWNKNNWNKRKF